jgi:hypothetical protein
MKKMGFLGLALLLLHNVRSQGCSDAGACSIGGLKNEGKDQYIALNTSYAVGEQNVHIISPQLEAVFKLGKRSSVQVKLPYIFTSGNLASTNGVGDITAVYSYRYYDKNKWQLGLNIGFKYGVNDANKKKPLFYTSRPMTSDYSYPMPYQTSLGTHDLLIGFDARFRARWMFGLALQLPVYQFNHNGFDTAIFYPSETKEKQYFTSAKLLRRPDLVFRLDRKFILHKKLALTAGVLPIYHLGHDRFTDRTGVDHALSGSKGLTLNLTGGLSYKASDHFSIILRYASPVIVRKVRPDGLTRHFVTGLELRYSF